MRTLALPLVSLLVLMAACGEQTATPGTQPSAPPPVPAEVVAETTVLDAGSGPQLCLGGVMESFPPQCGGPAVVGWDWDDVEHESSGGVRWGAYAVRGTWDGQRLTLTQPPAATAGDAAPETEDSLAMFASPCPEPAGGWRPVDPAKTSEAALQRAIRRADRLDGLGDVWLDQSPNPAFGSTDEEGAAQLNDPTLLVLNVRVVGDAGKRADAERQVREVWGAPCASPRHSAPGASCAGCRTRSRSAPVSRIGS